MGEEVVEDVLLGCWRRAERCGCERRIEERFVRWACRVARRDCKEAMEVSRSSIVGSAMVCRFCLMLTGNTWAGVDVWTTRCGKA